MGFLKGKFGKFLKKTVTGRNKVGKIAGTILPFKGVRSVVGNVVKGVTDSVPVPQISDTNDKEFIDNVVPKIKAVQAAKQRKDNRTVKNLVDDIIDLTDDGQINDSVDVNDLNPKTKKYIRLATSAITCAAIIYQLIQTFA